MTKTQIGTKTANILERIAISECSTNKNRQGNLDQIQATLANNKTFKISLDKLQTQIKS
jgi:hypothetical protein